MQERLPFSSNVVSLILFFKVFVVEPEAGISVNFGHPQDAQFPRQNAMPFSDRFVPKYTKIPTSGAGGYSKVAQFLCGQRMSVSN
jgi:hypothetical protein